MAFAFLAFALVEAVCGTSLLVDGKWWGAVFLGLCLLFAYWSGTAWAERDPR